MVKSFLSNYFGFNRQQRNGLLVLTIISFILLVIRFTYPSFMKPADIELRYLPVLSADSSRFDSTRSETNQLFVFDPNTASPEDLQRLGLSEKTAGTLIKFRKRHTFREAGDLRKVYGVSERLFEKLEPFVRIAEPKPEPAQSAASPAYNKQPAKPQVHTVELNTADSAALESLPGIGPAFASRILKYRAILGGFVAVEQLKEVYGFKPETYEQVKSLFTVDPSQVKKINLNQDDFKTVNRHPYISYELTKALFDWKRKTILNATNVKDIVADDALYQRLLPYLSF